MNMARTMSKSGPNIAFPIVAYYIERLRPMKHGGSLTYGKCVVDSPPSARHGNGNTGEKLAVVHSLG